MLVDFSFKYISWSAEDGHALYNIGKSNEENKNFYGPVVLYAQTWFIFSPGFIVRFRTSDKNILSLNFAYTPLIICRARDDHLKRELVFYDFLHWGNYFNVGAKNTFSFTPKIDIESSASFKHISGSYGQTYIQRTDNHVINPRGVAGAGLWTVDFRFGARIKLF